LVGDSFGVIYADYDSTRDIFLDFFIGLDTSDCFKGLETFSGTLGAGTSQGFLLGGAAACIYSIF
jgi:hypothetical protein